MKTLPSAMRATALTACLLLTSLFSGLRAQQQPTAERFAGMRRVDEHAGKVSETGHGSRTFDFGKALFGKLAVGTASLKPGDTLIVALAEKVRDGVVDRQPGGNIRYQLDTVVVDTGTPGVLHFPLRRNMKNTSGRALRLPDSMGVVLPFRAAEVVSRKRIPEKDVVRTAYHHRFNEDASRFHSSDTLLNRIWELSKHTIKATTFAGIYIDGDRERIPYEADALINQLSHYAVDSVYDIARNSIEYLMSNPAWPTEWQLQMHQMFWYDHLYTGSTALLRKYYPLLARKTLREMKGPNGLISTTAFPQPPALLEALHYTTFDNKALFRDITDWPQNANRLAGPEYRGETDGFVFCPYNSVVNAFHYRSVRLMEGFAGILGLPADVRMYRAMGDSIRKAFRETFRDPATRLFRDGDTTAHSSQHANFFALAFGLVDREDLPAVRAFIRSRGMACSVYGAQFLLDALYDAGEEAHAFSLMTDTGTRSWAQMLREGATMTAEAWDIRFKPNLDWNHAWGTAALNVMTRKIIGAEPSQPGCSRLSLRPRLSGLDALDATVPFINGILGFRFQRGGKGVEYRISVPGDATADFEVAIPEGTTRILQDGRPLRTGSREGGQLSIPIRGTATISLLKD